MAGYRRSSMYYLVPEDDQEIRQEAKAQAEIEVENEADAENESSQGDIQRVRISNTGTNLNVNGNGSNGQIANITQLTGTDTNTAGQTQTPTIDDIITVPVAIPVNTGDQTITN